jgi:hypothetical protein
VFLPLRRRIGEALSQLGLHFAFERWSAFFACLPLGGRIVQTGIQTQARDDANVG